MPVDGEVNLAVPSLVAQAFGSIEPRNGDASQDVRNKNPG